MDDIKGWLRRAWMAAAMSALLAGCGASRPTHVDGGVLGRVVIYRNGVAFYERRAAVVDGTVTVRVPRDRVDDFLKSLTVVDPATRKPLSVTIPRKEATDGSYLTMTLETDDRRRAEVLLTYVTEAPAWKPSYRVVVGNGGKVMLEGWAVVDNTTSEDWKGVLVGVGASSALAFRYDLWSVRTIDRDLLAGDERFATAPPPGMSPYAERAGGEEELARLDGNELRRDATGDKAVAGAFRGDTRHENARRVDGVDTRVTGGGAVSGIVTDQRTGERVPGATVTITGPSLPGALTAITAEDGTYTIRDVPPGTYALTLYYVDLTVERPNIKVADGKTAPVSLKVDTTRVAGETIKITGAAPTIEQGYIQRIPVRGRSFATATRAVPGSNGDASAPPSPPPPPPIQVGDQKLAAIAATVLRDRRDVVVEVHGAPGTETQAAARGAAVKNKLVNDGVPAARIHVVPKLAPGQAETVRVLAVAPRAKAEPAATAPRGPAADTPVGESHFLADRPMTVRAGTSAMVAMVRGETTGGVVYLYDPISDRGDARFAFKAVRLDNPTTDTLEPGPVTVYGDGRFIGEGITEPVPPRAAVVVPFALDRQVVIERNHAEVDRIAKLVTVQRGVLTAELQHRRQTRFTVTSRLAAPTTVYLRHRLESGWTLVEQPSRFTRVGDSQLFEVALAAGETKYVTIAEATPVERTFDLASPEALGMMKVHVDEPGASPQLKAQIDALLATHHAGADLTDKIATLRDQLAEYRARSSELHAQLVTLKAVRTGGELTAALRGKLAEMSDRTQKTTLELVDTQEKLMLARVKFQNQLAELRLTDATRRAVTAR